MIKKTTVKVLELLFPKYGAYSIRIVKNRVKRLVTHETKNKYLFILSPPSCGSTLLNEIISTSKSVSVNNDSGTREGQTLPSVKKIMFDHDRRWDITEDFDWKYVKKEWRKYWDLTRPILLEKSPPNIIRADSIKNAFAPSYFVILYRNPYAHCESLMKGGREPETAAEFALECLKYQKNNIEKKYDSVVISYERLTERPQEFVEMLVKLIPETRDMDIERKFSAHNFKKEKIGIQNLNADKINKLTENQLDEINKVFRKERQILDYFNYPLIERRPTEKA